MKALFLFLVLLNILYSLWQLQDGRASRTILEVADAPEQVVPLVATAPEPNEPAGSPRPPPVPLCVHLGVFGERVPAEQLRQRLLALGIQSSVISREAPGATNYWLVMKIVGGRAEAMAQLAILQERGIDSFLITEGPFADNVSLGVFNRDDNANARRLQLEAQGYRVEVERVGDRRYRQVASVHCNLLQFRTVVFACLVYNTRLLGCYMVKPHGQLVLVSSTPHNAYTPSLSTS